MSRRTPIALMLALLLAALTVLPARAHGHTEVGDYEIEIGFHNEPAYQGEPNGLDLFVTNSKTGEAINGLEDTLKVEIIYGASKKELPLEAQWGQDGAYTAYIYPTAAGDYTWHVWGDIEGTPVDVSMTSSPDTFSSVQPKSDFAFPDSNVDGGSSAEEARAGLIAGIAGAVLGFAGLVVALRGRRA